MYCTSLPGLFSVLDVSVCLSDECRYDSHTQAGKGERGGEGRGPMRTSPELTRPSPQHYQSPAGPERERGAWDIISGWELVITGRTQTQNPVLWGPDHQRRARWLVQTQPARSPGSQMTGSGPRQGLVQQEQRGWARAPQRPKVGGAKGDPATGLMTASGSALCSQGPSLMWRQSVTDRNAELAVCTLGGR